MQVRNSYPTDVSDEEWAFVAPYPTLLPLDAEQRTHDLLEMFPGLSVRIDNALRRLLSGALPLHMLPNGLPPAQGNLTAHAGSCR